MTNLMKQTVCNGVRRSPSQKSQTPIDTVQNEPRKGALGHRCAMAQPPYPCGHGVLGY